MHKKETLLNSLVRELQLRKNELKSYSIETIYFGGGTPSILSAKQLQQLLDVVYQNYKVSKTPEITLEANPDDLCEATIVELSQTPINRLSIGVQSFFEDDLKTMNRAHNAKQAKHSLKLAKQYFDNITIDLIYGIPNMSLQKWNDNLQIAFNMQVKHISSYALTVEPKTALNTFIKKGQYPKINDELTLAHFKHLVATTQAEGFVHYETSNFGKPHYFSKHNTAYWQGKAYMGIGPSAHSFIDNQRSWNVANNTKYLQGISQNKIPNTTETLSTNDCFNEYVMTGLRTIWGISLHKITTEYGPEYTSHLLASAKVFINKKLLQVLDTDTIIASPKGKFLIDGIASQLFKI